MKDRIGEIAEELKSNKGLAPRDLSEYRLELAGEYAYLNNQLIEILMRKPAKWNELRRDQKSDTATERIWEATADGLKEIELRLKLKSIEKLMSGIKTRIEIAIGESKMSF